MMNKKSVLALAAAVPLGMAAASAPAAIVINEFDSDTYNTPATDYAEFIELFSTTGTTTPLDGLTLVLFNGNGDTSYGAVDLDGLTTDASGFFVFGTPSVPGAQNTSFLVNAGAPGNFLQNGADGIALYTGDATSFLNGTPATTANLVDAVVYGTADPLDDGLLAALGETVQFDEGAPTPPNDASNLTLARVRDGSGEYVLQAPTPGGANAVPEPASAGLLVFGALLLARRRRT
jgi:uncharacterized protein